MENAKYIFLSYSREDAGFADRLKNDLQNEGFEVWMDRSKIVGGDIWRKTISDALDNSYALVWILSRHSSKSKYVSKEVTFAEKENIRIIPVSIEKGVEPPFPYHELHFIDMLKDYSDGLEELIRSIPVAGSYVTSQKSHTRRKTHYLKKFWAFFMNSFKKIVNFLLIILVLFLFLSAVWWYFHRGSAVKKDQVVGTKSAVSVVKDENLLPKTPNLEEADLSSGKQTQEVRQSIVTSDHKTEVKDVRQKQPILSHQMADHISKQNGKVSVPQSASKKVPKQQIENQGVNVDLFINIPDDKRHTVASFAKKVNQGKPVILEIIGYRTENQTNEETWDRVDQIIHMLQKRGLDTDKYVEASIDVGNSDKIVYKIVEE